MIERIDIGRLPYKYLACFLWLLLMGSPAALFAQETVADKVVADSSMVIDSDTSAADTTTLRVLDRRVMNQAFDVGEKLTFAIRYGIIRAGTAVMEVRDLVTLEDSISAYHVITTARSSRGFDPFYKVRDEVETFLDVNGMFSWRFNKRLREGGYKYDLLVNYDQERGAADVTTIRYHKDEPLRVRKQDNFKIDIPQYVLDVLGSFYYIRTQRLEVGEPIYLTNHDNKKIYDLQVIIQKRERIKVKAGEFDCIVIQPRLQGDAIFQQKGKMWVWLTDDERKIPVQMKSKIAVGSITTELERIEGVNRPITAQRR